MSNEIKVLSENFFLNIFPLEQCFFDLLDYAPRLRADRLLHKHYRLQSHKHSALGPWTATINIFPGEIYFPAAAWYCRFFGF